MKKFAIFLLLLFVPFATKADDLECIAGDYELYAILIPKNITCNSGQFLPANSENCSNCPNGYVCDGGTFSFDEKRNQGIDFTQKITNSGNNLCATNFPAELYATFKPKTVTLNFDDDNGNTTTTTCTYGGLVNLPAIEPTRPGYTFSGWKLDTNN